MCPFGLIASSDRGPLSESGPIQLLGRDQTGRLVAAHRYRYKTVIRAVRCHLDLGTESIGFMRVEILERLVDRVATIVYGGL